jgi:hypothetical protein
MALAFAEMVNVAEGLIRVALSDSVIIFSSPGSFVQNSPPAPPFFFSYNPRPGLFQTNSRNNNVFEERRNFFAIVGDMGPFWSDWWEAAVLFVTYLWGKPRP